MSANADLHKRRAAAVAAGVAGKSIHAVRALNAELWDADGRRFLDLTAGIAVTNTGHRHPRVMAAVAAQAEAFTHTCFHVAPYESYIRLCERLNALLDTGEANKSMLVSTGAEAVENAIKIARAATGRRGIIAFSGAFHGRTSMGMALTGKVAPYKRTFGPLPGEIFHAQFPNALHGVSIEASLASLDSILTSDIAPAEVAALIVEPVQGEGGFNIAPPAFLQALRALADRHGILLIIDEVQAGMGRTGRWFSIEHAGVKPDIVTLAKGLAGGFPLSAVVGKARVMDVAHGGGLGGTYGGNPMSVAAANAVLDVIEEEKLCARAETIGATMMARLKAIAAGPGGRAIAEVRGLGAMVAFELVSDPATQAPAAELTNRIVAEAEARGLMILACGTRGNVIRLLPALTIPEAHLNEAMDILEATLAALLTPAEVVA